MTLQVELQEAKKVLLDSWKFLPFMENQKLVDSFRKVQRELFVPEEYTTESYEDIPLPIPAGQTISQPRIVMMMINALELKKTDTVLEIGAGSGYNAAIMSKLCKKVYSVEIKKDLVTYAKENLKKAKIKNVEVIYGDGSIGLKNKSPFDKIIVTAATKSVQTNWLAQLKEKGILVAPIGDTSIQELKKIVRVGDGSIDSTLATVAFVPLVSQKKQK